LLEAFCLSGTELIFVFTQATYAMDKLSFNLIQSMLSSNI